MGEGETVSWIQKVHVVTSSGTAPPPHPTFTATFAENLAVSHLEPVDAEETSSQVDSRCAPVFCSKSGLLIVLWEEGFCHLRSPHRGSEQWLYQLRPPRGSVSRGGSREQFEG